MDRPITWTRLRDRLLVGANDRGGCQLSVYESHYLLQRALRFKESDLQKIIAEGSRPALRERIP